MDGFQKLSFLAWITMEDTSVQVGFYLKYLGLTLDSSCYFSEHFTRLVPRTWRLALAGFWPILGDRTGGSASSMAAVHLVLLYGAPVWVNNLAVNKRLISLLHSAQRILAI